MWWIWTVWPGYYPGRTKHIHFKASQKDYQFLTSQFYFRDDPQNARDPFYRMSLELDWFELDPDNPGVYGAYFDIVLAGK